MCLFLPLVINHILVELLCPFIVFCFFKLLINVFILYMDD